MGHHIAEDGTFRSDKYPSLPPDKVALSLKDPRAVEALCLAARDYLDHDPEFAVDLGKRLAALHDDVVEITLQGTRRPELGPPGESQWRWWKTGEKDRTLSRHFETLIAAQREMYPTAVVTTLLLE